MTSAVEKYAASGVLFKGTLGVNTFKENHFGEFWSTALDNLKINATDFSRCVIMFPGMCLC